jgi:hypothetical protein
VLKWISKALGGASVEAPADVPAAWAGQLEALLGPLDKLTNGGGRPGLARDILSYVLHGEPLAVLHEVSQHIAVGEHLRLTGFHYATDEKDRPAVYEGFDKVPAPVGLRWARLLEACAAQQARCFFLRLPSGTHWLEALLVHSTGNSITGWSSRRPIANKFSAQTVENMLAEAGIAPEELLAAAFADPSTGGYGAPERQLMLSDVVGYPAMLDRHLEAVRPLLSGSVAQRLHALLMLEKAEASTVVRLLPEIVDMAVSNSKQVRSAAEPFVRRAGKPAFAPLGEVARNGKPEQRMYALKLVHAISRALQDEEMQRFARDTAAADKAPSVAALIQEWDSEQGSADDGEPRYEYDMPRITWTVALTPDLSVKLDSVWKGINDSICKANRQAQEYHQRMLAQGHKYPLHQTGLYPDSDLHDLRAYLASDKAAPPQRKNDRRPNWQYIGPALHGLATAEGMTPVALLKMLMFFDLAADKDGLLNPASMAFNGMHRAIGKPTLLELSQMLEETGHSGSALLRSYCHAWGDPIACDWSREAVWPFFAHHLDAVIQLLTGGTPADYWFSRTGLFRAAATLPRPPATVVNALFTLALGPGKSDRPAAQEALAGHPGKEVRIIAALADGKADTRAVAAQWLARLRHVPAVPALEAALKKEKHDLAKGAMLDALEALGQPVDKYLDRAALAAEAANTLSKGLPKDLEWFPWSALPEVRWADTGALVGADLLRWMMVQAVKQKQPEPNTVLRKVCALFEPRDRERFGQFILETWLREDVRPISPDQAMTLARNQAQSTHQSMTQYPQYYQNDPNLGRSVEELTAIYLPGCLRQPAGSANGSKGLLALVAACACERAAAPVARYLKEWYGSRAAQGKALIAMLAWIDHPSATQLMLSIGSRFRTKSFQEEATRQATALAERKGWTLSELADRTIPTAGFDDGGELELRYGTRSFTARLLPDFKVELTNPDGKKIAALPEPRQDDDAELAKDAKKALSAAKKEIKSIVDLQTDRLYEALCTERDWSFEDWDMYINRHPVLRHLVQRLIWVEVEEGRVLRSFRPLDDGTLTDVDDEEVKPAADARIRLAHDSLLDGDQIARWQQHLADYEIVPLFQQMGKGIYLLPEKAAGSDSIKDFEGHLIEAFALRGRALKLGYTRGAAEDGGWFHVYEKRFPTLGVQAVIEFTGNPLPEENRTVALLSLSFASTASASSWQRASLPLNKVPKVLLSECYNDLRLIAAEGTGFDPEWQKKSEY